MAFLERLNTRERYSLTEHLNVISQEIVPGVNTILFKDDKIQIKHAVIIKDSDGLFQIIDICTTNGTTKNYEALEPMKFYELNHLDHICFGSGVSVQFHKTTDMNESTNNAVSSQNPKFSVPVTESLTLVPATENLFSQEIEIPETQPYESQEELKSSRMPFDSISQGILELTSEVDENSNISNDLFSQNMFAETSFNRTRQSMQCSILEEEEDDDELDGINSFRKLEVAKNSNTLSPLPAQSGSITPELEIDQNPNPQSVVPTVVESEEKNVDTKVEQETQDYENSSDESEVKFNEIMLRPTQPLWATNFRTRLAKKRQAKIKPKTVSLEDFEDSESPSPKKLRQCFATETQPITSFDPSAGTSARKERRSELKIVNRILISSDDDSEDDRKEDDSSSVQFNTTISQNKSFVKVEMEMAAPKTPKKLDESPLIFDALTPDFVPKLPPDSQLESFLAIINSSQNQKEISPVLKECVVNIEQPKFPEVNRENSKIKRHRLMKYGSDDEDDKPLSNYILKLPQDSKPESFLAISQNQKENSPVLKEFVINIEQIPEVDLENFKIKRHRLMNYGSDDKDDKPKTNIQEVSHGEGDGKPLTVSNKGAVSKEVLDKASEVASTDEPEKIKRPRRKSAKQDTDGENQVNERPKRTRKKTSKKFNVAVSSLNDVESKQKCQQTLADLGGSIVDSVQDADLLLTNGKIKMTSKFLASICKGIPIVGVEFFEASTKAGKWLNPFDFIIVDKSFETKKKISLKSLLENVSSESAKMFSKYCVFMTRKTIFPLGELSEIIENGGGKICTSTKTRLKKPVLVYSDLESDEAQGIIKKYPNISLIKDSQLYKHILEQKVDEA